MIDIESDLAEHAGDKLLHALFNKSLSNLLWKVYAEFFCFACCVERFSEESLVYQSACDFVSEGVCL